MESVKVTIQKMVHGGQGMASLPDGRKVFVWNALPGEEVVLRMLKSKKGYAEAIADQVITPSSERVEPVEPASFMATSPWQIMTFEAENNYKKEILAEAFEREHVSLPKFSFVADKPEHQFGYRNKMEFGLWGDEDGIHLAHFVRGSHGKTMVTGSALAMPEINKAAEAIIAVLNTHKQLRAGDIKSIMLRANQSGQVVAALFVKREDFLKIAIPKELTGLVVYYSNPKSPASVPTKLLQLEGERTLQDTFMGAELTYDVLSFFQVNVPVFTIALSVIDHWLSDQPKIDLYSGVGSIGIAVKGTTALIEIDEANISMAKKNVKSKPIKVVHASAEKAVEYITSDEAVIVDPPRAGLHQSVTNRISEVKPPVIAYLSCNPSTQARDVALLTQAGYKIVFAEGYNFFPRTPHIESLIVLELKK